MEDLQAERSGGRRAGHSGRPVAVIGIVLGALAAAYLVFCGVASSKNTFYPNYTINNIPVGGLTQAEAAAKLDKDLPDAAVAVYFADADEPADTVAVSELGFYQKSDCANLARQFYEANRSGGFFTAGWRYLAALTGSSGGFSPYTAEDGKLGPAVSALAERLSLAPINGSYTLEADTVRITVARDGYRVDAGELQSALLAALTGAVVETKITVTPTEEKAQTLSVTEIHDAVAAEVKNAGYDAATDTITPEQLGAEFDVDAAQKLVDAAQSGETVDVPATLEYPTVTAEDLKAVLFRDVLGSAKTHVSGTAARISNVKLASRSVNGTVLNSGDVFSYNETVGQRTEAKGYQPAPAYVKGETVDEIGGGVCQPSSTLYLATLNSNLEIVERAAHRYVPAYIAKGMDATVSWGGPDYKFRNDTDYPIKIVATYSGGYLTMQIFGTKTDSTRVKMTNKVLSTTEWKTVTKDDPTLAAGTQEVKVTPYTGYKVESYRNLYDGDGSLISSKLEAVSDYKVRDKIILVGPKPASGGSSGEITEPTTDPSTEPSTDPSTEPETPVTPPVTPVTPAEPEPTPETPTETGEGA